MVRMAAGTHRSGEEHRLARHARRCHSCRKRARELTQKLGDRLEETIASYNEGWDKVIAVYARAAERS